MVGVEGGGADDHLGGGGAPTLQEGGAETCFQQKYVEKGEGWVCFLRMKREIIAVKHIPDVRLFFEYRERERDIQREPEREREKQTERHKK